MKTITTVFFFILIVTNIHSQPGHGVLDIDGNFYRTVIIGNQEWMAENLRVTRDAKGIDITRYCYEEIDMNCDLYGGLYTWETIMNKEYSSLSNPSGVQGICPEGWHIPSDAEWQQLIDYVVEQGFRNRNTVEGAGNALKSCRQVGSPLGVACATTEHPRWGSHRRHYGFDEFGFSALPGGIILYHWGFYYGGHFGFWWSSTQDSDIKAFGMNMFYLNSTVSRQSYSKSDGLSLRCVRNIE